MIVEVARRVRVPVSDAEVRRIVMAIKRSGGLQASTWKPKGSRYAISIAFVSHPEIRRLNRIYRGEDRITDVLAFPSISSFRGAQRRGISQRRTTVPIGEIPRPDLSVGTRDDEGGGDIGEVVICPSYVKQQAKRVGEPFRRELARVLIHGTLHLLGYDHRTPREAERMFAMQEALVRAAISQRRSS